MPTSTARSVRSSSQSISSSAKVRVSGCPPELADPIGPVEVGEHQDVEQLGAWSGAEGIEALPLAGARVRPGLIPRDYAVTTDHLK
jgi:hypothetical protein